MTCRDDTARWRRRLGEVIHIVGRVIYYAIMTILVLLFGIAWLIDAF